MSGPYGYKSEQAFKDALNRELRALEGSPADKAREQPKAQRKPTVKGKAGSRERIASVAKVAQDMGVDRALVNAMGRDVAANRLLRVVRELQRQGFSVERVQEAVALTVELDRADVAQLIWETLPEDGTDDAYEEMLTDAIIARNEKAERDAVAAERKRLDTREAAYQAEYALAESVSEDALDAVDSVAQTMADELYDERVDPNAARAVMRAAGVQAESQRSALAQLNTQQAIIEEIKRGPGAPGSSWTDEQREKWESEIDAGAVESASRHLLMPDEAAEFAVETVMGPPAPSFMDEVKEELKRYDRPEHADRLRDIAVEEWEQQHPEHR